MVIFKNNHLCFPFCNLLITLLNCSRIPDPGVEFRRRFYLREVTGTEQNAILLPLGKQNSVFSVVFSHNNTVGRKFLNPNENCFWQNTRKFNDPWISSSDARMWKESSLCLYSSCVNAVVELCVSAVVESEKQKSWYPMSTTGQFYDHY